MTARPLHPVDLRRRRLPLAAFGLALALAVPGSLLTSEAARADTIETSVGEVRVEAMATGLTEPWAIGFLPEGGFLVTERGGRLLRVDEAADRHQVSGVPRVAATGQGGLLDLMIPRDFAQTRELFLTFAETRPGGLLNTSLAVGRLSEDLTRLDDVRVIFRAMPGFGGGRHFGSRVAEGPEGHLFMTLGDRGSDTTSQDRSNHNGTVVRLNRDGSVPGDNPFVGQEGVLPEIWSWGHRNAQGLAFDADGRLWSTEHGPRGGDELNLVEPGLNYGWPVIGEGVHYSGRPMPEGREAEGMIRPLMDWSPALAPSGLAAYSGTLFPGWQGHLFAGSLQQDRIAVIDPDRAVEVDSLQAAQTGRIRDVREGPEGAIWFLSIHEGGAFRIVPAE